MEPSEILHAARTRQGLTQTALARRAGTSQPVISAYEHGRRDPAVGTLRRLVAAAGERLDLRLAPEPPDVPPPGTPTEHGTRLVDVLLLGDALPAGRRGPLEMPRLVSR